MSEGMVVALCVHGEQQESWRSSCVGQSEDGFGRHSTFRRGSRGFLDMEMSLPL